MDDYYWAGPAGWTICRVWVDGRYQHELWHTRGEAGRLIGMRASFEAAIALFDHQTG
ncbi:hypothetical protein [Achromobacter sp.]|nr:hypothetical protein [Achromobacter sp.]